MSDHRPVVAAYCGLLASGSRPRFTNVYSQARSPSQPLSALGKITSRLSGRPGRHLGTDGNSASISCASGGSTLAPHEHLPSIVSASQKLEGPQQIQGTLEFYLLCPPSPTSGNNSESALLGSHPSFLASLPVVYGPRDSTGCSGHGPGMGMHGRFSHLPRRHPFRGVEYRSHSPIIMALSGRLQSSESLPCGAQHV